MADQTKLGLSAREMVVVRKLIQFADADDIEFSKDEIKAIWELDTKLAKTLAGDPQRAAAIDIDDYSDSED